MIDKENLKSIIVEIQNNYRNKLETDEEIFYHILERIEEHIVKLKKLKKENNNELFRREVADLYLLSLGLIELEKIDSKTIKDSADYYLNKIKELFAQNGK